MQNHSVPCHTPRLQATLLHPTPDTRNIPVSSHPSLSRTQAKALGHLSQPLPLGWGAGGRKSEQPPGEKSWSGELLFVFLFIELIVHLRKVMES